MKIGELARRSDVSIDTVRYYERAQLLPAPRRSASGYRHYSESDVVRLAFVRSAKVLGFSLAQIRDLQTVVDHRGDMAAVKDAAQTTLEEVERKLAELLQVRETLRALVDSCPGEGQLDSCPILGALDEVSP